MSDTESEEEKKILFCSCYSSHAIQLLQVFAMNSHWQFCWMRRVSEQSLWLAWFAKIKFNCHKKLEKKFILFFIIFARFWSHFMGNSFFFFPFCFHFVLMQNEMARRINRTIIVSVSFLFLFNFHSFYIYLSFSFATVRFMMEFYRIIHIWCCCTICHSYFCVNYSKAIVSFK